MGGGGVYQGVMIPFCDLSRHCVVAVRLGGTDHEENAGLEHEQTGSCAQQLCDPGKAGPPADATCWRTIM